MPYATRDDDGPIVAVHPSPSKDAQEKLAPVGPERREFLSGASALTELQSALMASDLELVRVLEDLISVLIDKRIIMLTDLPKAAQQKLANRYELRSRLGDLGGLVAGQEEVPLP